MKKAFLLVFVLISLFAQPVSAQKQSAEKPKNKAAVPGFYDEHINHLAPPQAPSLFFIASVLKPLNKNYEFHVRLKDGTNKVVKSKIHTDNKLRKNYILYNDVFSGTELLRRIYPAETDSITRYDPYNPTIPITGIVTDSCWLFKAVYGPVNMYSMLSETDPRHMASTLIAIQAGEGEILSLTKENMLKLVGTDTKATELVEKGKYFKAVDKYNENIYKAQLKKE